jgi:hypothetical protein
MSGSSNEAIIARAADHMVRQHGRHAADFAAFRSRELRAQGALEAADLWAQVSRTIEDRHPDGAPRTRQRQFVA